MIIVNESSREKIILFVAKEFGLLRCSTYLFMIANHTKKTDGSVL